MQKIIDDFIKHKQLTQASITQNTSNSYSNDLGNFLLFLKLRNIKQFKYIDRNLLDEYYFTNRATGYPGPGIIPSPNRNFYFMLEYKF